MYRRTLEQMLAMASAYDEKASIIAEEYGLEYKLQGHRMIYYSYFGKIDGIYKIIINLDTGEQTRKRLAYEKTPKHLKGRINYYVGQKGDRQMKWEQLAADRGIFVRKCSICGSPVIAGYCVNDGMDYYCSDDCLHMVFTDEEWSEAYEEDWGYYTEWFDEYDDDEIDIICNELTQSWEAEQKGANNE